MQNCNATDLTLNFTSQFVSILCLSVLSKPCNYIYSMVPILYTRHMGTEINTQSNCEKCITREGAARRAWTSLEAITQSLLLQGLFQGQVHRMNEMH